MSRTRSPRKGRNEGRGVAGPRPRLGHVPALIRRISVGAAKARMRSCGGRAAAPIEVAVVLPNPVHDDSKFARNCDLGTAHADPGGEAEPPGSEFRGFGVAGEQDVSRLEQI